MAYGDPEPYNPLAVLMKSFRIGRPFGIELRVYVTAILVAGVAVAEVSKWAGFEWGLVIGLLSSLLLYLTVFTHELGHALAARRYGIRTPVITLSAFGGLAHLSSGATHPGAEVKIALAGPATHLVWLAIAWPLAQVVGPVTLGTNRIPLDVFRHVVQLNLGLLLFNLLPAFPMDGGRALRGALALRMHPNRATLIACRIGIVFAIGIAAYGTRQTGFWSGVLIVIAINNVLACVREMAAARHTDGPYQPVDPWSSDGEEWKRGVSPERHAEIASEVLGAPPLPRRIAVRSAEDDAELDRLLDRVREVGIARLSGAERERLAALSALAGGRRRP